MNLRFLRTFVLTAELGGLGKAAGRLHLSEPAASRQIHALEQELGVSLFERIGRQLRLTAEGEDLLRQGRRLLTDADLFLDRARALKRGHSGTLRIGATPQTITALLAPFLPRYRRRYPDVEVQLIEGSASRQRSRLERGEIHLAIMPAGDGRLMRRPLFPVHALLVLPKTHRLARHTVIEVRELASERLLLLQREYASRAWFDAACEMALVRPLAVMESTTAYTLIELAEANFGVAVVPSTSTIQSQELRAVPLVHRGVPIGQWSTICWDPLRLLAPYAEGFLEELVGYARREPPGRRFLRRGPHLPEPPDGNRPG